MNANEIRKLLDRYYDGQTTEAEEELKRFFDGNGVPAEMAEEQAFSSGSKPVPPVPEGLEQRISRQIDGWNTIEKTSSRRARIVSLRWIIGIAACLLLIFSIGFFVNSRTDERISPPSRTHDNPEDAYAETQRALMKFSNL